MALLEVTSSTDAERVGAIIKDSVSLICTSSLTYTNHMTIDGVIGVSMDGSHVILVNLREIFHQNETSEAADRKRGFDLDGCYGDSTLGVLGQAAMESLHPPGAKKRKRDKGKRRSKKSKRADKGGSDNNLDLDLGPDLVPSAPIIPSSRDDDKTKESFDDLGRDLGPEEPSSPRDMFDTSPVASVTMDTSEVPMETDDVDMDGAGRTNNNEHLQEVDLDEVDFSISDVKEVRRKSPHKSKKSETSRKSERKERVSKETPAQGKVEKGAKSKKEKVVKEEKEAKTEIASKPENAAKTEGAAKPEASHPDGRERPGRIRKFFSNWLEDFPWLTYKAETDKMFCKICQASYKGAADNSEKGVKPLIRVYASGPFVSTGCSNMKRSVLTAHEKTQGHLDASEASPNVSDKNNQKAKGEIENKPPESSVKADASLTNTPVKQDISSNLDDSQLSNEKSDSSSSEEDEPNEEAQGKEDSSKPKKRKRKQRTIYKFCTRWLTDFEWLTYHKDTNRMYCAVCQRAYGPGSPSITRPGKPYSGGPFVSGGCANMRRSVLTGHEQSQGHIDAVTMESDHHDDVINASDDTKSDEPEVEAPNVRPEAPEADAVVDDVTDENSSGHVGD